MKPELSKHVQQEMQRRGIPLAVLQAVLEAPKQKVPETAMWYVINRQPRSTAGRICSG